VRQQRRALGLRQSVAVSRSQSQSVAVSRNRRTIGNQVLIRCSSGAHQVLIHGTRWHATALTGTQRHSI